MKTKSGLTNFVALLFIAVILWDGFKLRDRADAALGLKFPDNFAMVCHDLITLATGIAAAGVVAILVIVTNNKKQKPD